MNSSTDTTGHNLARITAFRAKRFLEELANLSDDAKAVERFEKRFNSFLPWAGSEGQTLMIDSVDSGEDGPSTTWADLSNQALFSLRDALRSIWTTSSLRTREWKIFLFQADPTKTVSFLSELPPPFPSHFQQAVVLLFKNAVKLRHCRNSACPAPFFLARRSSQEYCSEVCALPAQRNSKLRWWQKNGKKWRKLRAKESKPMRRT